MIQQPWRVESNDNVLFITHQCNNRCLCCAQPPSERHDLDEYFAANLALLAQAPTGLQTLGITGGEPTLLGERLFELLAQIHRCLPETDIHLLSNGRAFAKRNFTRQLAEVAFGRLLIGIPLHSDYEAAHDAVCQVRGAYGETLKGLYQLARHQLEVEIRVVITALNYRRLPRIADFIFRNLPFAACVSFMGLEVTGHAVRNLEQLWIDPFDYQGELTAAVSDLAAGDMNVSIMNLPHCLLPPALHCYAQKSISDWKVTFAPACSHCRFISDCCGLFRTSCRQSRHIR